MKWKITYHLRAAARMDSQMENILQLCILSSAQPRLRLRLSQSHWVYVCISVIAAHQVEQASRAGKFNFIVDYKMS